jgi:hypothetical protein
VHHRRKPHAPLTTRGKFSRIVTIRLPYDLEDAIKEVAEERQRPWQTVLKELLAEAVGLEKSAAEVKRIPATALYAAARRLKRKP